MGFNVAFKGLMDAITLQDSDLPIGHDGQCSLVRLRDWKCLEIGKNFNYHFLISLRNSERREWVKQRKIN
jgi:hypothetical protein